MLISGLTVLAVLWLLGVLPPQIALCGAIGWWLGGL